MKRSEMINQIELFILECSKLGFNLSETSKVLLDFIEGCGMLPPGYEPKNDEDHIISFDLFDKIYEWEPEDG